MYSNQFLKSLNSDSKIWNAEGISSKIRNKKYPASHFNGNNAKIADFMKIHFA